MTQTPSMPMYSPTPSHVAEQVRGITDSATEFNFTADEGYWEDLLTQAQIDPGSREPPAATRVWASHENGKSHYMNFKWLRAYTAGWERANPHVVSITHSGGEIEFRSSAEFWHNIVERLPTNTQPTASNPRITIKSELIPGRTFVTTQNEWNAACSAWEVSKQCSQANRKEMIKDKDTEFRSKHTHSPNHNTNGVLQCAGCSVLGNRVRALEEMVMTQHTKPPIVNVELTNPSGAGERVKAVYDIDVAGSPAVRAGQTGTVMEKSEDKSIVLWDSRVDDQRNQVRVINKWISPIDEFTPHNNYSSEPLTGLEKLFNGLASGSPPRMRRKAFVSLITKCGIATTITASEVFKSVRGEGERDISYKSFSQHAIPKLESVTRSPHVRETLLQIPQKASGRKSSNRPADNSNRDVDTFMSSVQNSIARHDDLQKWLHSAITESQSPQRGATVSRSP